MVLSDSQLEILAWTLDVNETNTEALATYFQEEIPIRFILFMEKVMQEPLAKNEALKTQPCTWNMLFRRRFVCRVLDRTMYFVFTVFVNIR